MNKEKIPNQKESDKIKKQLEKLVERSIKPNECFKLLSVFIDENIVNIQGGSQFLETFTSFDGPTYQFEDMKVTYGEQFLPNSIRWVVENKSLVCENENWKIESTYKLDQKIVLLIHASDLIKLINGEPSIFNVLSIDQLNNRIKFLNANVTILLMGMEHEMIKLKSTKSGKSLLNKVEEIFAEMILFSKITIFKFNNFSEAANMAIGYSKAIAQTAHKNQIQLKSCDLFDFSLNSGQNCAVSTNCSDGNLGGVDELWRQQLMQFRGLTGEIADAIRLKFKTPKHLFDCVTELTNTHNEHEAIMSIANIEVRRGTDILAHSRRIGVEIATRIYKFITANQDQSECVY